MQIDWPSVGQGIGIIGLVGGAALAMIKGHRKSDGTPPPDRPPAPNEVKETLAELRRMLEGLIQRSERHRELTDDDLSDIKKQLDRIEAAQRLQDAVAGIRREFGGIPK